MKNPQGKLDTYKKDGEPTAAFSRYKDIVESLNLIGRARTRSKKALTKQKQKYKLLVESDPDPEGKGFLFTARPPSHVRKKMLPAGKKRKKPVDDVDGRGLEDVMAAHRCNPDILVMPTDNRALLEKLTRCMGEIDAGNRSLVNIAVPLKEEAIRRGLISANNPVFKNLNWTLA